MDRCPYIISYGTEGVVFDYCELTHRVSGRLKYCLLMSGDTCPDYEEIKKEWEDE